MLQKLNIFIGLCCLLPIYGIYTLVDQISVNSYSTIEQTLSADNLESLQTIRQTYGIEPDSIIVSITGSYLSEKNLALLEQSLLTINVVSNVLSIISGNDSDLADNKQVLSENQRVLLFITLNSKHKKLHELTDLTVELQKTINANLDNETSVLMIGSPHIREASWRIAHKDMQVIIPLLIIIIIIVTFICFSSVNALLLALLITSLTTFICLLGQQLFYGEINTLIVLMVPVIWSISTLDAFHLYDRARYKTIKGNRFPVYDASKELFIPCLLTSLTTAGCFATLLFQNTSPLMANVGVWGIAGSMIAFILTFTLGTKLLSYYSITQNKTPWLTKVTLSIVILSQKNAKKIITFWVILLLLALPFLTLINVKNHYPQVFTSDHSIAGNIVKLKNLTQTDLAPIEIVLTASDKQGSETESLFTAALLMSNYARTITETRLVFPYDLFSTFQLNELSKSQSNVQHFRDHLEGNWKNWISFENNSATVRIQLHLQETSYNRKLEIIDWLHHFDQTMLEHHNISITGPGYLYFLVEQLGLDNLKVSSFLSILLIIFTMIWITGRTNLTMIALTGIIIPSIILMASMPILKISWSITLLPIPAMLIGLMADDIIHLLWPVHNNKNLYKYHLRTSAICAAPALLATTLVLSGAIATLTLSGIKTNHDIGILLPIGLIIAFLCNLSLIPALIGQIFTNKNPG